LISVQAQREKPRKDRLLPIFPGLLALLYSGRLSGYFSTASINRRNIAATSALVAVPFGSSMLPGLPEMIPALYSASVASRA
jgi:hypothetical protein